jgi:ATP synthase protein I
VSALLGGWVSFAAGLAYGAMISRPTAQTGSGAAIRTLLRAEALKITLIVMQIWAVLSAYKGIVPAGFFLTFAITVILFGMAFFVKD